MYSIAWSCPPILGHTVLTNDDLSMCKSEYVNTISSDVAVLVRRTTTRGFKVGARLDGRCHEAGQVKGHLDEICLRGAVRGLKNRLWVRHALARGNSFSHGERDEIDRCHNVTVLTLSFGAWTADPRLTLGFQIVRQAISLTSI